MKKRSLWIGAAVVLLVAAIAVAVVMHSSDDEQVTVQTAPVKLETIVQTVNATGRIQPKTQVRISADVSAKIIALHVEEGDWVDEGQLLAELDRERYTAAVERAEANVRSAQANAELVMQNMHKTRKDFERAKDLVARKLESQSVKDTVEAAYNVEVARYEAAQEEVNQSRATLKQALDDLSKTNIYAPMAGTISDLDKEVGEIAIGSQFQEDMIMVVADLREMEAQVNVDENDIVGVAIGQQAEIEVDALFGEKLTGTVYEIANSANVAEPGTTNQKTEFEVKIAIGGDFERLRPGMTASADISTKTKENVVGIPIQSVAVRTLDQLMREGEEFEDVEKRYTPDADGFVEIAFCVADGSVDARQVRTGIQSDELIEIVSGIDAGEVVVTGSYRAISSDLKNGAQVTIDNDVKKGGGA
ncbi:MAG TPA: efflux RND transporter periplasmic adaptor subunit [Woeseiaceae bacterium]|nr:efflux RND transporter periplasmic adaptor subunit [Woeseiaceae bacterium]